MKLPIGIDNFEKIRTNGFYYVDKTMLIQELLLNWAEVNLFTRPRRFGKSLNMSMLKYFFEVGCDKSLFSGLHIVSEKELCEKYMGQFPVISITLKSVDGADFETACSQLRSVIGTEAERFPFLASSEKLTKNEKEKYLALVELESGCYTMADVVLLNSLQTLSMLLFKHYGRKVIILIDEYDVPLDKAFQAGYYDEMVLFVRNMFGSALKGNENLQFAVLTGCLRISKESIFTGLNNPKVHSIVDYSYDEYFGFTDQDVRTMLDYYDLTERYEIVKEWYDGYQFGEVSVYCPWDVINYCYDIRVNQDAWPRLYWVNTSGNYIVKNFIQMAKKPTQNEIETLIAGEGVWKKLNLELTYRELNQSIENLWSVLFTTGYLTQRDKRENEEYLLVIPNKEIRQIFITQIKEWFSEMIAKDMTQVNRFCDAFAKADAETIEKEFTAYLKKTISIRDTSVQRGKKENFYHGILLGIFMHKEEWTVYSNAESGDGYSDILIEIEDKNLGIIIEVKYAERGALDAGCAKALEQIGKMHYEEKLAEDGMETILKYGIACYKKSCKVVLE